MQNALLPIAYLCSLVFYVVEKTEQESFVEPKADSLRRKLDLSLKYLLQLEQCDLWLFAPNKGDARTVLST